MRQDRRTARLWRWLKYRLGIDAWQERRERQRRDVRAINDHILAEIAMEFGYKECEKGHNIQMARLHLREAMRGRNL